MPQMIDGIATTFEHLRVLSSMMFSNRCMHARSQDAQLANMYVRLSITIFTPYATGSRPRSRSASNRFQTTISQRS